MTWRRSDSGRFDAGAANPADLKIGQVQQAPPAGQFAMI
jgi:hypothetical protein